MIVRILIGIAIGGALGALLGSTRSCETGGCPLTATPLRGGIYGGVMGLLFALSLGGAAKPSTGTQEHPVNAVPPPPADSDSTATTGAAQITDTPPPQHMQER